ncbi:glycosyltransferase [Thioalkalivibrio sp. ALE11]|uniref:glycosyltransferase n=1 Tax=Thioalkalivibrio sp. ALE11 TaxID=1265494 RepID=UPI0018C97716|nr:glycosyltransferase [Thioalkalivibrio sp. ALE11]
MESAVALGVEQTRDEFRHVLLYADHAGWRVVGPEGEVFIVRWPGWAGLPRILRYFGLSLCHVHHWLGDRSRLLRQVRRLDIPYGLTIHDHYLVCPRIHLVPPGSSSCGAPEDAGICDTCLHEEPRVPEDPWRWRDDHFRLLQGAQFILAPSEYAQSVVTRNFPGLEVSVIPHEYRPPGKFVSGALSRQLVSVGVVGGMGPEKGGAFVEELAGRARARGLPLRFVVLGDTHRHGGPQSLYGGHLFVHGGYCVDELPALLQHYEIAIAAFPAVGPETFSLTLSEVWASGIPALVPEHGALAERVERTGGGWVIRGASSSADVWIDTISERLRLKLEVHEASRRAYAALSNVDADASGLRSVYRQAIDFQSV